MASENVIVAPWNRLDVLEELLESRGRTVNGQVVPTPWQGRFWNYQTRGGMNVPLDGEVAWLLPAGEKPYWRGRISDIAYEFTEPIDHPRPDSPG